MSDIFHLLFDTICLSANSLSADMLAY